MMRVALAVVLVSMALAFAACTRCDIPTWGSSNACHSDRPASG